MKFILLIILLISSLLLFSQEICNNGIDDDGDGLVDLNDGDCDCLCNHTNIQNSIIQNIVEPTASSVQGDFIAPCGAAASFLMSNTFPGVIRNSPTGLQYHWDQDDNVDNDFEVAVTPDNNSILETFTLYSKIPGAVVNTQNRIRDMVITWNGGGLATLIDPDNQISSHASGSSIVSGDVLTMETHDATVTTWRLEVVNLNLTVPFNFLVDFNQLTATSIQWESLGFDIGLKSDSVDVMSIAESGTLCNGNYVLTAQGYNVTEWQWYKNNVALVGETNNVLNVSTGNYNDGTYQVKGSNSLKCDTMNYIVDPSVFPIANFNLVNDCAGEDIAFQSLENTGVTNWEWQIDNVSYSNRQDTLFSSLDEGIYSVTLIVENGDGCVDELQQNLELFYIPEINILTENACEGSLMNFVNNSPNLNSVTSWVWNFSDGSPLITGESPDHTYTSEGNYDVSVIASSVNGCVSSETYNVDVYPLPIALFSAQEVCEGAGYSEFTNLSTVDVGSLIGFEWLFGDGQGSSLVSPNHTFNESGTYDVKLMIESSFGCKDTFINPYTVNPKPESNFVLDVNSGCSPLCVDFTNNSQSNASSIVNVSWLLDGDEVSNTTDLDTCIINELVEDNLDVDVGLVIMNDFGCVDSLVVENMVTVYPNPISKFKVLNEEELDIYNLDLELYNQSEGATSYLWHYLSDSSSEFEPNVALNDSGMYLLSLIVRNSEGCVDSSEQLVNVNPVFACYVPNAFTPDGDGLNDFFVPVISNIEEEGYEFFVFDRWGSLVFYARELDKGWDGTFKNIISPQDVYEYKVQFTTFDGESRLLKGHVSLIR